jgi:predicted O-methyltransferase YrrM
MAKNLEWLKFAERFILLPHATVGSKNAAVSKALTETLWNTAPSEQRAQSRRIEHYRSTLLEDKRNIAFVDFGMGARGNLQDKGLGMHSIRQVSEVARVSKPAIWCRLLHNIVRATEAKNCVEMGTSLGISACYIASALPPDGRLVTMEGAPAVAGMACETLRALVPAARAEIVVGPFRDTLDTVLERMAPIDFVFVDGHHEGRATEDYCDRLTPKMRSRGVMVFDDIRWSPGMLLAWQHICTRVPGFCVDLGTMGLVLLR